MGINGYENEEYYQGAKRHFVMIIGSMYQENTFLNMYFPNNGNNRTAKYLKYDLAKLQGKYITIIIIIKIT